MAQNAKMEYGESDITRSWEISSETQILWVKSKIGDRWAGHILRSGKEKAFWRVDRGKSLRVRRQVGRPKSRRWGSSFLINKEKISSQRNSRKTEGISESVLGRLSMSLVTNGRGSKQQGIILWSALSTFIGVSVCLVKSNSELQRCSNYQ